MNNKMKIGKSREYGHRSSIYYGFGVKATLIVITLHVSAQSFLCNFIWCAYSYVTFYNSSNNNISRPYKLHRIESFLGTFLNSQ